MPRVTVETTGERTLATGAQSSVANPDDGRIRLPQAGWLTRVSLFRGTTGNGNPLNVHFFLDVGPLHYVLKKAWSRNNLSTLTTGNVDWEGRIPLDKRENFLSFFVRNDTGATESWFGFYLVENE